MGGMVKGKSDPYVKIRVGGTTFKSRVIKENLNPVWNELYEVRQQMYKSWPWALSYTGGILGNIWIDTLILNISTFPIWVPLNYIWNCDDLGWVDGLQMIY